MEVISLGLNCAMILQLKKLIACDSYGFDCMITADLDGLVDLMVYGGLDTRKTRWFEYYVVDEKPWTTREGNWYIRCNTYKTTSVHDAKLAKHKTAAEAIEHFLPRKLELLSRFRDKLSSADAILFFRMNHKDTRFEEVQRLNDVIGKLRDGKPYKIHIIRPESAAELRPIPNVIQHVQYSDDKYDNISNEIANIVRVVLDES